MNKIVLFGAGRSSLYLINYLNDWCINNNYTFIICDKTVAYAQQHTKNSSSIEWQEVDIFNVDEISVIIDRAALVISLLPASMHIHIAKLCLKHRCNMATASYISDEMKSLNEQAKEMGLIFLNELGLDPGLDHLSAIKTLHLMQQKGYTATHFESYCGGLVQNESDGENPWKYKFTWNPRNVVVAGQGGAALFRRVGLERIVPYHQLFNYTSLFTIHENKYEGYPNRDSLKYEETYGIKGIPTLVRGTLRKEGYCSAWQVLVLLGLTDDSVTLHLPLNFTLKQWIASYLPENNSLQEAIMKYTNCSKIEIEKLKWLGLFSDEKLPMNIGTSAQILEEVLKKKWALQANDKDLIVMLHQFNFERNGETKRIQLQLELIGENAQYTAMAKTVGLPLAIGCRLILEKKISSRGVLMPIDKEWYEPILTELEMFGIVFKELELE